MEADESEGYVGARVANATRPGQGYLWTYFGLDSDSKLVMEEAFGWSGTDYAQMVKVFGSVTERG